MLHVGCCIVYPFNVSLGTFVRSETLVEQMLGSLVGGQHKNDKL
jgi:hypothetical protein